VDWLDQLEIEEIARTVRALSRYRENLTRNLITLTDILVTTDGNNHRFSSENRR
jgi:hypothetical protein